MTSVVFCESVKNEEAARPARGHIIMPSIPNAAKITLAIGTVHLKLYKPDIIFVVRTVVHAHPLKHHRHHNVEAADAEYDD
jgi:hypothetical protein